ncbi:hypothetical protein ZWY2020_022585 [Hordeum vulgare]|nr:hypothetical protein ZWY2020_022585 [Hordeum vulgare]
MTSRPIMVVALLKLSSWFPSARVSRLSGFGPFYRIADAVSSAEGEGDTEGQEKKQSRGGGASRYSRRRELLTKQNADEFTGERAKTLVRKEALHKGRKRTRCFKILQLASFLGQWKKGPFSCREAKQEWQ